MTQNLQSKIVEKKYLLTFILITSLFALWGFANDITNPMVAAFQTVMELSAAKASLVQFAFYGGYATMAIPAALFAKRYSYKKGILLGLILYAIGAFMFIPAANRQEFGFFCVSLYILTFGLAFLETTANPYILSLGSKETSTRRLNLAQAFNPIGSLLGMFVASRIVLAKLESDTAQVREIGFSNLDDATKLSIREHDLDIIRNPYVVLGCVVILVFIIIAIFVKDNNNTADNNAAADNKGTMKRLFSNKIYREGVLTQFFYVAAQIMTWTFIIQYADRLGIDKATAQIYNIIAMGMFLCGRFISTFLMRYVNSRKLLMYFAIGAMVAAAGTILIDGIAGLYCLMAISIFMSLMFPTIYGIALENVSLNDSNLGAAFLVMAIVGGSLMPPIQGMIIDLGTVAGLPAVNFSFILPFICFLMIFIYGFRASRSINS
ncbi:MAG: L-fucose:H+ symporter permease [Bacteroidales bacterium]|nr:L-fucose:H+ symporter permease [Bacteroidales bacterium]